LVLGSWFFGSWNFPMTPPIDLLASYLRLAQAAKRRGQPLVRDRVLLLAGVIAAQIDLAPIAGACRELILAHNPRHLVGRWPTISAALVEEDFQTLVNQLSTRYGPERVEGMVERLEIDQSSDRAVFASDGEFAASLLGLDWGDLVRRYPSTNGGSESDG
jgi:hypothetical protein